MHIFIPSLGRADKILGRMNTVFELPKGAHDETSMVVQPQEAEAYRSALRRMGIECRVLECPEKGIAATRRWIAENSPCEKILMLDDDLKFQERISDTSPKFNTYPSDESKLEMLATVERVLDTYAHAGIADRVAGSRVVAGGSFVEGTGKAMVQLDTRLLRALAYRRTEHLACEHGRVDVMEDFDIALQLLAKGYHSANIAWWVQDQRSTQWKGGCSTYRTHELHERSARRLAELHPHVVSLRQKVNKGGGDFGTRTEVTIQWRKAYASAR